jgi:hypothetical protein
MYLDCKYVGINNFKLIDYAYDEYFVLDCNNKYIYNAFLICKPGNKIMYECIYRIVKHVDEKFYGVDALAVTGPAMLSEIYCNYDSLDNLKLKHNFFGEPIEENTSLNTVNISEIKGGSKTIFGVYPNYRKEQYAYQKTQHYSVCWHDKKIYA